VDELLSLQIGQVDPQSPVARSSPFQGYEQPAPLLITPWVAASLLQKAIRRGRLELALEAAATLLAIDPRRLWRRLACIAAEDVGLGDLYALRLATEAFAGKKRRAELGGEWNVACTLVRALSAAVKCRAADDLLVVCQSHPALAENRSALRAIGVAELIAIVLGSEPILERALALYGALGGDWRSRERVLERRRAAQEVFDALGQAGWPKGLVECARLHHLRTRELLAPFVLLLAREAKDTARVEAEGTPPEEMIDGVPTWAYDVYCREGRAVLTRFIQSQARSAIWLRRNVRAGRRLAILGHILFRVEGGLVDHRLCWTLGDWLRQEADLSCSGPDVEDASELLSLVRADIPALNRIRAELLHPAWAARVSAAVPPRIEKLPLLPAARPRRVGEGEASTEAPSSEAGGSDGDL
jgi:hypothetical protein